MLFSLFSISTRHLNEWNEKWSIECIKLRGMRLSGWFVVYVAIPVLFNFIISFVRCNVSGREQLHFQVWIDQQSRKGLFRFVKCIKGIALNYFNSERRTCSCLPFEVRVLYFKGRWDDRCSLAVRCAILRQLRAWGILDASNRSDVHSDIRSRRLSSRAYVLLRPGQLFVTFQQLVLLRGTFGKYLKCYMLGLTFLYCIS